MYSTEASREGAWGQQTGPQAGWVACWRPEREALDETVHQLLRGAAGEAQLTLVLGRQVLAHHRQGWQGQRQQGRPAWWIVCHASGDLFSARCLENEAGEASLQECTLYAIGAQTAAGHRY